MPVTDKPVPGYASNHTTVCHLPDVQLSDVQSQLTTCSSIAGQLLFSLAHCSSPIQIRSKCRSFVSFIAVNLHAEEARYDFRFFCLSVR